MIDNKKGKPFLIILIAVVILVGLSFVPWSKLTGGYIKDFNLIGDLIKGGDDAPVTAQEQIDPELQAAEAEANTISLENTEAAQSVDDPSVKPAVAPRQNDIVIIEDYTTHGKSAAHLRNALDEGHARIAVIGDSYIEGDIFTMHLRQALQSAFGGSGVGYMPASSKLTGFRTSVRQSCDGWKEYDIRKNADDKYKSLAGEYFVANGGAKTSYKGTSSLEHLDKWNKTTVLFANGTLTLSTDIDSQTATATAEDGVKSLVINGETTSATLSDVSAGTVVLGVYLDNAKGILVDNMSLRGNSGITHRKLNLDLASRMRNDVDYDMIIVEYGINALDSKQKDYSNYENLMVQTVETLKRCYPNADILVMGIGDRGQKINGTIMSVPTSQNMVDAQRNVARRSHVLFWDTREAMGGDGAVIDWRERKLINPDYIHLNAKGGDELSKLLVKSLRKTLDR